MAEHPAVNRRVAGSSPARGVFIWSVGQGVKTPPFHGGNAGSNPARIMIFPVTMRLGDTPVPIPNTSIPGSNPGGASQASVESRGFFFCTKADCWEKKKGLTKPKKESILINNS